MAEWRWGRDWGHRWRRGGWGQEGPCCAPRGAAALGPWRGRGQGGCTRVQGCSWGPAAAGGDPRGGWEGGAAAVQGDSMDLGASWLETLTPAPPPLHGPHQPPHSLPPAPFTPLRPPPPTALLPLQAFAPHALPRHLHPLWQRLARGTAGPCSCGHQAGFAHAGGAASPPAPRLGCITPVAGVPRAQGRGDAGRTLDTHPWSAAAAWPPAPPRSGEDVRGVRLGMGWSMCRGGQAGWLWGQTESLAICGAGRGCGSRRHSDCPLTPGKCPLWGRRTPGAPGNIPETLVCKEGHNGVAQGWARARTPAPQTPAHPAPAQPDPLHPDPQHRNPLHPQHWHGQPPVPILPDALGDMSHGFLGDEDVAGKAAQHRVLGDEPKVAAGGGQGEGDTHTPLLPHGVVQQLQEALQRGHPLGPWGWSSWDRTGTKQGNLAWHRRSVGAPGQGMEGGSLGAGSTQGTVGEWGLTSCSGGGTRRRRCSSSGRSGCSAQTGREKPPEVWAPGS